MKHTKKIIILILIIVFLTIIISYKTASRGNDRNKFLHSDSILAEHNSLDNELSEYIDEAPDKYKELLNVLMDKYNNDASADELIKTVYTDEELQRCYDSDMRLDDLIKEMPIECARKNGNLFYVVYKSEEGNYLFLLYNLEYPIRDSYSEIEYKVCLSSLYSKNLLSYKDYKEMLKKKHSVYELQEIDPCGMYLVLIAFSGFRTPNYSMHYTSDGHCIKVMYDDDLNMKEVKKFDEFPYSMYNYMLSVDRELCLLD